MKKVLTKTFFERDVLSVAPELIGMWLVRKEGDRHIEGMIIEAEAYDGEQDLACHACRGKTPRNSVMYGDAGHWYVYLCYGIHYLVNIVTGKKGYPAAVLIRGVMLSDGTKVSGPGRVSKLFGIGKESNAMKAGKASGLWIEDRGTSSPQILRTPRIGIEKYAGPVWAKKPYRFVLEDE